MKKIYLFVIICSLACKTVLAQNTWKIDAGLPINFGNNFIAQNYVGILQLGVKKELLNLEGIRIGPRIDAAYSNVFESNFTAGYESYTASIIANRLMATGELELVENLNFMAGLGFNFSSINVRYIFNGVQNRESTQRFGITSLFGFNYNFHERYFAQLLYNFSYLMNNNAVIRNPFNSQHQSISAGVGLRF